MANYHAHIKVLSRSTRNTVRALAYRAGTDLVDRKTGELSSYAHKEEVTYVALLLPDNAPQWAKDLKELVEKDRQAGVQKLSDIAEGAEKRKDSQVYKDFEFSLPHELTREQNIKLINEFVQDQFCQRGITALVNFHEDFDPETGQKKPHCHTVILTRELTETGIHTHKNRDWNKQSLLEEWREQLAAYTNFHLQLHGHHSWVDHRSYADKGIDIEPQPKLSRGVREMEQRLEDPSSNPEQKHTDKAQEFRDTCLKNMYRIMKQPEVVFDIIHKSQSTFMWGDVEKILARYLDDREVFNAYSSKLKNSPNLVMLREIEEGFVYTTQSMLKKETHLVELATKMSTTQGFEVSQESFDTHVSRYDEKFKAYGGLSPNQKQALRHITQDKQLVAFVGYAGTGKTSILECAQDIWKENEYQVVGLAPTGKAAQNLQQSGINAMTVHKFLSQFEQGRCHFNAKTILILDEAGMVDVSRFEELLSVTHSLGVKLVVGGDGQQLQPIEAGPALRLVTGQTGVATLHTVIRQKENRMRKATKDFGQAKTQEAINLYQQKGHLHIINEIMPDLEKIAQTKDYRSMVEAFNLAVRSQRLIGWTFRSDIDLSESEKALGASKLQPWKNLEKAATSLIHEHLETCKPYIRELESDPYRIAENIVAATDPYQKKHEAVQLIRQWQLNDHHLKEFKCDLRKATISTMLDAWQNSFSSHPEKSHLMMAYTNRETELLNQKAREIMKQKGIIERQEYIHIIERIDENDFGDEIRTFKERSFAKGDRLQFMRNDNGLNVRNGMLGTVEEVNKTHFKVRLDADKGQEAPLVSFAVKLYPYFDHGWATTVSKSQGSTTDKAFLLSSNHFNRNLSYVGMTRHREDVQVFGTSLEFWNEAVMAKQMAKAVEKLSSLDYLEPDQALKLIRQESSYIKVAFDKIQTHLTAAQYIAKRTLDKWLGKPPVSQIIFPQESLTEAQRAQLLEAEKTMKKTQGEKNDPVQRLNNSPKKEFYDREQVFQQLTSNNIEEIIRTHVHQWVDSKGEQRFHDELRLGAKKGFVANLKTGMWYSHYHSQGGDIFRYVSDSKNISYHEAIKEIALTNGVTLETSPATIAKTILKENREDQKKLQEGKEKSQNMWAKSIPLQGTCGEIYLREKRHILGEMPEDIRFIPEQKIGKQKLASLVSFARNVQGEITGYQEIFLNPKTGEKASNLDVVKRSGGYCKASTVCIQQGTGNTFIAEGIETALSLKSAGIQGEILSGFGRFVFKNALPTNKNVVLCADYDGPNAPTHKALLQDKAYLESKGYDVSIIWPETTGEQKVDFNDVLKKEGPTAIKQMIEKQLDYKYEPLAKQYGERAKEVITQLKNEQQLSQQQEKERDRGAQLTL